MIEVFKTNVQEQKQAKMLVTVLSEQFPLFKINFDLDDCDKILRVDGTTIAHDQIIELVTTKGYECSVLA